jgi:hypothetical protein
MQTALTSTNAATAAAVLDMVNRGGGGCRRRRRPSATCPRRHPTPACRRSRGSDSSRYRSHAGRVVGRLRA